MIDWHRLFRATPRSLVGLSLMASAWTAPTEVDGGVAGPAAAAVDRATAQASVGVETVLVVPHREVPLHLAVPLPAQTTLKGSRAWSLARKGPIAMTVPAQLGTRPAADGSAADAAGQLMADMPPLPAAHGPGRFQLRPAEHGDDGTDLLHPKPLGTTGMQIRDGQTPVLVYNHGTVTSQQVPRTDHRYQRACYIHPLWGLTGETLTDDFPKDHYHHHGVYWAWPHVDIDGRQFDLWTGRDVRQEFVRWICRESGPVAAVLAVENGWFADNRKVMIERVWIRVFGSDGDGRCIDITIFLIPVGKDVTLWGAEGKGYGGLTMRFAPRPRGDTTITVPGGRAGEDLLNTPLAWADLTATFAGMNAPSGAAVFVSPRNPGFPHAWLTRHYGVLCVGWPGVAPMTLRRGTPIRLDYRVWVHKEPAGEVRLRQAYEAYAAATQVTWQ